MNKISSLNQEQKEAFGLLQIGTFLEYFDVMLYVHMAVVLNELFFPKTDAQTEALLAAFAFCSTYIFRPIGALFFGWLGDTIGRKSTIIYTTLLMSISCIVMASLPTYAQIGITATWVMTICRMAQGISSMGEIVGAQIYITETTQRPISYFLVALVSVAADIGAMFALGISFLVTSFFLNWRLAFWIGAGIAFVGFVARIRLRETPAFINLKRQQIQEAIEALQDEETRKKSIKTSVRKSQRVNRPMRKTLLSCFMIYCGRPLTFYLGYMYFNPMLKSRFGYSAENIIEHNFCLSVVLLISACVWSALSVRIHPLKIIKVRSIFTALLMFMLPYMVINVSSAGYLFIIQAFILILQLSGMPANAVLIYHLPIYSRFRYGSFIYALSRAFMYVITSFGLILLGDYLGPYGLWLITLPIVLIFMIGVKHFEELERKLGMYPNLSKKNSQVLE